MNRIVKIVLYVVLIALATALACGFAKNHSLVLAGAEAASRSRMMVYLGSFIGVLVVLGVLAGLDIAHYFGTRAQNWVLQGGDEEEERTAGGELEEAERLRAQGRPLDAIQSLRDYLNEHPGEFQIMSRIAEMYSRDLNNPLAAALEYEDLLKKKVEPDQWAWAALHLAKLYGKLDRDEDAVKLLERIATEHGESTPAKRARVALQQLQGANPEIQDSGSEEEQDGSKPTGQSE
jgi:signal transduction histidine kinase